MYAGKGYPPNVNVNGPGPPPRYPSNNVYMNQKQVYNQQGQQPRNSPLPSHVSPNRVLRPPTHQGVRSSPGTNSRSPYRGQNTAPYTGPGGAPRSSPPPRGPTSGLPPTGRRSRRNSDHGIFFVYYKFVPHFCTDVLSIFFFRREIWYGQAADFVKW